METTTKNAANPPVAAALPLQAPGAEPSVPLTYGALHDLLSPANQVCSLAGLLVKQYGNQLGTEAEVIVGLIQGSTNRLQNLVAGFRAYVDIVGRQPYYQLRDANVLLSEALHTMQAAIQQSGAQVSQDRLPELYCDATQIRYVFAALLENALKFRSERTPEIHVSALSAGNSWVLSVRDNGIGIDPKDHRRIFEIFRRVHNDRYPGAGVGLATAKNLLEKHGGAIWVDSEPGSGATFSFSIPRAEFPETGGVAS